MPDKEPWSQDGRSWYRRLADRSGGFKRTVKAADDLAAPVVGDEFVAELLDAAEPLAAVIDHARGALALSGAFAYRRHALNSFLGPPVAAGAFLSPELLLCAVMPPSLLAVE